MPSWGADLGAAVEVEVACRGIGRVPHFTYVSSVEQGERNISLENIVRLAAALEVDPGTLVPGADSDP